jgi:hypothetical protein
MYVRISVTAKHLKSMVLQNMALGIGQALYDILSASCCTCEQAGLFVFWLLLAAPSVSTQWGQKSKLRVCFECCAVMLPMQYISTNAVQENQQGQTRHARTTQLCRWFVRLLHTRIA